MCPSIFLYLLSHIQTTCRLSHYKNNGANVWVDIYPRQSHSGCSPVLPNSNIIYTFESNLVDSRFSNFSPSQNFPTLLCHPPPAPSTLIPLYSNLSLISERVELRVFLRAWSFFPHFSRHPVLPSKKVVSSKLWWCLSANIILYLEIPVFDIFFEGYVNWLLAPSPYWVADTSLFTFCYHRLHL